jgi:hypothetical protein
LAKQEKGVVAGLPPASDRTTTTEVETRPSQSKAKQKQHAAITHIPCGSQANVLEEAHGICALALHVLRLHTAE